MCVRARRSIRGVSIQTGATDVEGRQLIGRRANTTMYGERFVFVARYPPPNLLIFETPKLHRNIWKFMIHQTDLTLLVWENHKD